MNSPGLSLRFTADFTWVGGLAATEKDRTIANPRAAASKERGVRDDFIFIRASYLRE
jgi:hypothetical protein